MRAAAGLDHPAGVLVAERGPVAPVRGQCVVEIRKGHDACGERDGRALQTIGIAGAVPLLVVRPGRIDAHAQEFVVRMSFEHLGQRRGAKFAVLSHFRELFRG